MQLGTWTPSSAFSFALFATSWSPTLRSQIPFYERSSLLRRRSSCSSMPTTHPSGRRNGHNLTGQSCAHSLSSADGAFSTRLLLRNSSRIPSIHSATSRAWMAGPRLTPSAEVTAQTQHSQSHQQSSKVISPVALLVTLLPPRSAALPIFTSALPISPSSTTSLPTLIGRSEG